MHKLIEIIPDGMPSWAKNAMDEGQFFNVACKAMDALEEIREIYAGMDGFVPQTDIEIYQERIIIQMFKEVIKGIGVHLQINVDN